ncbi:MAG: fructosamine kinase family protein [Treponema sp.]|nr:fructosamine kinase family protein [Treponema sp.]
MMKAKVESHYKSLQGALDAVFPPRATVVGIERIDGGDINKAYELELKTGVHIFMKSNSRVTEDFFIAEALGLCAIESTGTVKTPAIICTGTDPAWADDPFSFLVLEYIHSGKAREDYWETFGHELAAMHLADTKELMEFDFDGGNSSTGKFGFFQDNFIGERPQKNSKSDSWISFFRDNRLSPQFRDADSYFSSQDRTLITRLLDHLDDFLIEPKEASLLHGDLWSGNVMCGPEGKAMLIDPAVYVGHAEVDLAMTELFGGFPERFYAAYNEANPLEPEYKTRRDIYNLYQLLNHLNLFGSGYLGSVLSIVRKSAGEI